MQVELTKNSCFPLFSKFKTYSHQLIQKIKRAFKRHSNGVGFKIKQANKYEIKVVKKGFGGFQGFDRESLRIKNKIASGSNGAVYEAAIREKKSGKEIPCVVKRLHHKKAGAVDLYYEATALKLFTQKGVRHIPLYIGSGIDKEGMPFLVMEACEKGTLADKLERPLPPKKAASYLRGILEGVKELHSYGIVHQDLKAENILFKGKEVKIGDLGEAKRRKYFLLLDASFQLGGTPEIHGPEYGKGTRWAVSRRSDLWSIGLMILEMLFGLEKGRELRQELVGSAHKIDQALVDAFLEGSFSELDQNCSTLVQLAKGFLQADINRRISIEAALALLDEEEGLDFNSDGEKMDSIWSKGTSAGSSFSSSLSSSFSSSSD